MSVNWAPNLSEYFQCIYKDTDVAKSLNLIPLCRPDLDEFTLCYDMKANSTPKLLSVTSKMVIFNKFHHIYHLQVSAKTRHPSS